MEIRYLPSAGVLFLLGGVVLAHGVSTKNPVEIGMGLVGIVAGIVALYMNVRRRHEKSSKGRGSR